MGSTAANSEDERRIILGHSPQNPQDVWEVFAKFVERKIPCKFTMASFHHFSNRDIL